MPATPLTSAGVPRRVPRANLAPGMLDMEAEQEPSPVSPAQPTPPDIPMATPARSPEEVRSMLSSYRSGVERGRESVAGLAPVMLRGAAGLEPAGAIAWRKMSKLTVGYGGSTALTER